MSGHQSAGQIYYMEVATKCFENVAELKYFGTAVTNQFSIYGKLRAE
jgi:hypothetical protein